MSGAEPEGEDEGAVQLANAFDSQAHDPSWSRVAERQLVSVLSEPVAAAGSSLKEVQCRDTPCQLRSSHADRARYDEFLSQLLKSRADGPWNGSIRASGRVA